MFYYLFLSFLATVLAHGDRETYTKICGGMRRGVSVFYKGVPTSELFSLTLYDQRKGSCGRKTDFSRSIRPFYAAHIGRFPMDLRKNNSIFLAYGGPEGRRFAKSSYFDQPEPRDDRKFTIEIRMVNDTCARYYVDKNEVGDVCNRYFRDANCLVSSNGVDIRRHWVKGDPGCSQEADDNSYSRSDDNSRYDDDDDDDSDDRSDSSRGRRRGRRSARSGRSRSGRRDRRRLDSLERKIRRIAREEVRNSKSLKKRAGRRGDSDEDSREPRIIRRRRN